MSEEGAIDKVYSPYSAFVAMTLTTLLAKGSTRAELLQALQFDSEIVNAALADQIDLFIKDSECLSDFAGPEYDPVFDRVL